MKLHSLKCPNCNAKTPLDTGVKMAVCEYCGSTVFMPEKAYAPPATPAPAAPAAPARPPAPVQQAPAKLDAQYLYQQGETAFANGRFADAATLWQRMVHQCPTSWQGWYGIFKVNAATEMQQIKTKNPLFKPSSFMQNTNLQNALTYMDNNQKAKLQGLVHQHDTLLPQLNIPFSKKIVSALQLIAASLTGFIICIIMFALLPAVAVFLFPVLFIAIYIVYKKIHAKNIFNNISYDFIPEQWNQLYAINNEIIRFNTDFK